MTQRYPSTWHEVYDALMTLSAFLWPDYDPMIVEEMNCLETVALGFLT